MYLQRPSLSRFVARPPPATLRPQLVSRRRHAVVAQASRNGRNPRRSPRQTKNREGSTWLSRKRLQDLLTASSH
ncbi:hypothetical protein WJX73_005163 [Symbiochloris irregularis]|uniref:Uncharacterized protein n=1 Tax=Symbiochloris irregularis TaxID=706552 RepID=A0AAW1PJK7_9CHLO